MLRSAKTFLTVVVLLFGASQAFGQTYGLYNPSTGTWNTYQMIPSTNGFSVWNPQPGLTNYPYGWNGNVSPWNPQTGVPYYSTRPTPNGRWVYNNRTGRWTYYYYSR